ncbi:cuticle protein 10.9-like [Haemaphysalis longicornis]
MFTKALLVALVAVTAAAAVEEYPPQPYSFSYDTTDEFGTRLTRDESSDANNFKVGSYSYTDATGVTRTVKYTADADGFHATVETNEPGTKSSNPADALYSSSSVEVAPAPAPVVAKPVTVTAVRAPVTVHAVHAAPFTAHPVTFTAVHPAPFAFAKSA